MTNRQIDNLILCAALFLLVLAVIFAAVSPALGQPWRSQDSTMVTYRLLEAIKTPRDTTGTQEYWDSRFSSYDRSGYAVYLRPDSSKLIVLYNPQGWGTSTLSEEGPNTIITMSGIGEVLVPTSVALWMAHQAGQETETALSFFQVLRAIRAQYIHVGDSLDGTATVEIKR